MRPPFVSTVRHCRTRALSNRKRADEISGAHHEYISYASTLGRYHLRDRYRRDRTEVPDRRPRHGRALPAETGQRRAASFARERADYPGPERRAEVRDRWAGNHHA